VRTAAFVFVMMGLMTRSPGVEAARSRDGHPSQRVDSRSRGLDWTRWPRTAGSGVAPRVDGWSADADEKRRQLLPVQRTARSSCLSHTTGRLCGRFQRTLALRDTASCMRARQTGWALLSRPPRAVLSSDSRVGGAWRTRQNCNGTGFTGFTKSPRCRDARGTEQPICGWRTRLVRGSLRKVIRKLVAGEDGNPGFARELEPKRVTSAGDGECGGPG
jgi:hypothetical protein